MQIRSERTVQLLRRASFTLISTLIIAGTSCLQHISIPVEAEAFEDKSEVLVTLKSGKMLKVSDPRLADEWLTGRVNEQNVKLHVSDIVLIEYEKPDVKRFVLFYTLVVTSLTFVYLALAPTG